MTQQVYFEDVQVGDEIPTLVKQPSPRQLVKWAGASGDYYEIHYDSDFARKNQLGDVVVHGRLKAAFLGQLLTDWIAPNGAVKKMSCRYKGTDPVEEDMLIRGTVTAKREDGLVDLDVWTERPDGSKTTQGTATVELPVRGS